MKFDQILEKVKDGHKRLASAVGSDASGTKVKNYMDKLEKEGKIKEIVAQGKKKGLSGEKLEKYKWGVIHKMLKGHFD